MKILLRGTNWIGDAVMSIPAMRELRRIFPDAHITLHTRTWADGLFQDASFIDEIVTFDKHRWPIKDVIDNSRFLREESYDITILFPNSFESALTSLLSKSRVRIGYNKDVRGLLLTDPVPVPDWKNRRHEVYYYLNLIAEAEHRLLAGDTVGSTEPDISLEISNERISAARRRLGEAGVDLSRKIVAIGAGSTNSLAKRWPAVNFAQLNDRLQSKLEIGVVLLGASNEISVSAEVLKLSRFAPVDLTGHTDVADVMALLAGVDVLVAYDMGLAHIAPAVGTKTVVMFGPTDPVTTRPFSPLATVVRHDVECSPCLLRECPIDHRCMTGITVDAVFEAVAALL